MSQPAAAEAPGHADPLDMVVAEFEAITVATAEAADTIMEAAENVDAAVGGMADSVRRPVAIASARIFEACSFQDVATRQVRKASGMIDGIKTDGIGAILPEVCLVLEEIVSATESAANAIMAAAEQIDGAAGELESSAQEPLNLETVRIFEACSFQDISGQRVQKVTAILASLAEGGDGHVHPGHAGSAEEVDLLNGPQLPGQSISQDDIDALFDS